MEITLNVYGHLYLLETPYDLYIVYNDFLIDYDAGKLEMTSEELDAVEAIRDYHQIIFYILVEDNYSYVTHVELEDLVLDII